MAAGRVMVIGLDAATLDLARPWAEEGRLPNLARFLRLGAAGPLASTFPATSPAAWSTFATGLEPGAHGVTNFYQLRPDRYDPYLMNAARRRGTTFWETAGRQGIRGGILNVPFTFPPRPYNGFLISCMLTPAVGPRMATPPEALHDLLAASPHYAIDVDLVRAPGRDPDQFLGQVLANLQARVEAAVGLYHKHRPPLFCVVFVAADRVCHFFWPYLEAARAGRATTAGQRRLGDAIGLVYEKLDEAVGMLLSEAGKETDVIILSDHGAGPLRKGVSLHRLLAQEGFLVEARAQRTRRLVRSIVWRFARRAPRFVKAGVKSVAPRLSEAAAGMVISSGIDFSRTRAYAAGCGVFVNLRGRQPCGVVEPGPQYEDLRSALIALLSELKDPETGQRVARRVCRREEIWSGPCLELLPDVVVETEDEGYFMTAFGGRGARGVFFPLPPMSWTALTQRGGHRRDGLLLAMGPHIRQGEVRGARIADVPATVLALLGCPIPETYAGRVLSEMLTEDVPLAAGTPTAAAEEPSTDDFTEADRADVSRRLKGLGYQ